MTKRPWISIRFLYCMKRVIGWRRGSDFKVDSGEIVWVFFCGSGRSSRASRGPRVVLSRRRRSGTARRRRRRRRGGALVGVLALGGGTGTARAAAGRRGVLLGVLALGGGGGTGSARGTARGTAVVVLFGLFGRVARPALLRVFARARVLLVRVSVLLPRVLVLLLGVAVALLGVAAALLGLLAHAFDARQPVRRGVVLPTNKTKNRKRKHLQPPSQRRSFMWPMRIDALSLCMFSSNRLEDFSTSNEKSWKKWCNKWTFLALLSISLFGNHYFRNSSHLRFISFHFTLVPCWWIGNDWIVTQHIVFTNVVFLRAFLSSSASKKDSLPKLHIHIG